MSYEERLKIPVNIGGSIPLFTSTGLQVATGYQRIVIGGRGPYVEFKNSHIIAESLSEPSKEQWRRNSLLAYYDEKRTKDSAWVKIYVQKKEVDYADYHVGRLYISPFDLYTEDGVAVIDPIRKKKPVVDSKLKSLF